MTRRFLEQNEAIHLALLELKPDASDDVRKASAACDIKILKELCDILHPFEILTETISTETKCSISFVHSMIYKLREHLKDTELTCSAVIAVRDEMIANVNTRYCDESADTLIKEACFLDPRFKSMP